MKRQLIFIRSRSLITKCVHRNDVININLAELWRRAHLRFVYTSTRFWLTRTEPNGVIYCLCLRSECIDWYEYIFWSSQGFLRMWIDIYLYSISIYVVVPGWKKYIENSSRILCWRSYRYSIITKNKNKNIHKKHW